jgi:hypothetical protein
MTSGTVDGVMVGWHVKRSIIYNHISHYTSTGRRLPARPPLGESLASSSSLASRQPVSRPPPARGRF